MTLTIDLDDDTRKQLELEASLAGQTLEAYALGKLLFASTAGVPTPRTEPRKLGWAAGRGLWISDDFDEPLEDFKDYM